MISKGFNGKISDIAELAPARHQTRINRFLSNDSWDEKLLEIALKVYGHQILVSLLSCDGLVLPYSIDIYDKKFMSKIKLTQNLISTLPKPEDKGFVLCDSWYSCKDILTQYTDRWAIERFFRDCKTYL